MLGRDLKSAGADAAERGKAAGAPDAANDDTAMDDTVGGGAAIDVYRPTSALADPALLWAQTRRDLAHVPDLAWRLFVRDIRVQYRESFLGLIWAFVPPILWAAGLTLAHESKVVDFGRTDIPYPAYVLISVTLWQVFLDCALAPVAALAETRDLHLRLRVPVEGILLSKLGGVAFNTLIRLMLVAAAFVAFDLPSGWSTIAALPAIAGLAVLGLALGGLLAPVLLFFNDAQRAFRMGVNGLMFLTPVIYAVPSAGLFGAVVGLNPVTPVLVTVRDLAIAAPTPMLGGYILVTLAALAVCALAWLFQRLCLPILAERAGA